MTAYERTGWRDQELSGRQRAWGFNCPAVDLDFLMVEYNLGRPVAIVEYKHHRARVPDVTHATYRALRDLADGYREAGLPFLLAFYWPTTWAFKVWPLNERAVDIFCATPSVFTERQFVSALYTVRSLAIDEHVLARLNTSLPEQNWQAA